MSHAFQVVSYNVLANSYVNPQWYSHVNPELLPWEKRKAALALKIAGFGADVICLQEVEEEAYAYFAQHLSGQGYAGLYAKKEQGKPDGCATFFKPVNLPCQKSEAIYYRDDAGGCRSGHLALLASFELATGTVNIVNTHLKWDLPEKPPAEHWGYRQINELLTSYVLVDNCAATWILCGDLNATPDSTVIHELRAQGFTDAYQGQEQSTCNPQRQAKRIDYIFQRGNWRATPGKLLEIADLTPLPSATEPSDHLAVRATFSPPEMIVG